MENPLTARTRPPQPPAPAWPASEITPEEQDLVSASTRARCLACPSPRLRPLVLLAREAPASFVYSHDAIFGCDQCHGGYAEKRHHDSFDWEEVHDQDEHHLFDADSIAQLRQRLTACPSPLSELCQCKIHESLRASWTSLPSGIWDEYTIDFPRPLLQMADPDQDRWVIPHVAIESINGAPRWVPRAGEWRAWYENGDLRAEGHFTAGQMNGKWTFWYPSGVKRAELKFSATTPSTGFTDYA